jgi:hypothetical protein
MRGNIKTAESSTTVLKQEVVMIFALLAIDVLYLLELLLVLLLETHL